MTRDGPLCFCAGRDRYREFTRELPLEGRIDVVVVAEDPDAVLTMVFGARYSRKVKWPSEQPGAGGDRGSASDILPM
ncbi:MAG TPA: hypothetical protein VMM18_06525 [Gemmatimonadaceae bacterium]|nr:hypothetical protein [Gemmatimonadaceae bacterium]